MLVLLDELLRNMLMSGVQGLKAQTGAPGAQVPVVKDQIGFRAPDHEWTKDIGNLMLNGFNVYLVDVRENRKLRSNERSRNVTNGVAYEDPAPTRLDCHYLISVWSPTSALTVTVEPVLDEHALLYEAAAVLMQNAPFNPSRVYPANSGPLNAWPARFRDADLPTVIAPSEGFPKLAEFWGTMGTGNRWKPVVYLVITIPVELLLEVAGPMVTTTITEYRQVGSQEPGEVWIQIGGTVINTRVNPPIVVPGTWVQLETPAGKPLQTTESDSEGRFKFGNLQAGHYRLRAWAVSLGERLPPVDIEVPSPIGSYDIRYI